MLDTPDAVMAALRENDARPYGRPRTVAAEEIVDAAEQFEEPGLQVMALLELMEAYEYDGERTKSPVVFARVLKLWDKHPDEFSDWAKRQVFWRFKWVATALLATPDVPLEAIRRWHTEMRTRYTAAGHDLQPYHAQRFHLAAHAGLDREQAFELWATRQRTEFSDCGACEIRSRAVHHVLSGDDARALTEWQPVFDGQSSCREEPYSSHAHALLPLLRLGRTDEARTAHLTGYRYARGKGGMAREVGLHLEFCALSGNEPRGLEILAENRDLFDGQGDPLSRLDFLTGVEVLIAALDRAGHGELAVSGPPGANWTVAALLAHVRAEAGALAARFDARNGTDTVGARRRTRLERRPLLAEPLALGVRAASPLTPQPDAAVPAPRAEAEPLPEDFTALVVRARELARLGHPDADRMWQRIAETVEADGYTHAGSVEVGTLAGLHAEIAEHRASEALDRSDAPRDRAELDAVAELFAQAGMAGRVLVTRARASIVGLRADGAAADWTELDAILREAEALLAAGGPITDDDYLAVLHCRAYAAHHDLVDAEGAIEEKADGEADGEVDEKAAAELVERFETAVEALRRESAARGFPHRVITSRQYLADAAARRGRLDEAEAGLREIIGQLEAEGLGWRATRTLGLLGQVLLNRGEFAEAVSVLHRTIAEATRWGERGFPYGQTYAILGHASLCAGDPGGAVRALSEAAARFDRSGAAEEAAQVRLQLSDVLNESGRGADAVAVLESVLLDAGAAELDERLVAQVRLNLARGLYGLEEYRDAAEEYLRLADTVAGWEDQDTHTMVACEATVALAEAGRWEAAHAARERALASHAKAPRTDQVAGMLRGVARLTMAAEGPAGLDAALAHLAEAEAVRERAESDGVPCTGWHLRGAAHYERARCHAEADRPEDALADAELAIAAYEAGGADGEEPRAETVRVAAIIEGGTLGRTDAARARLTAAIRRCEQAGLPDAARVLSSLHDRLAADRG